MFRRFNGVLRTGQRGLAGYAFATALLLMPVKPGWAAIVEFIQISEPPGIFAQTNYLDTPTNVVTVTAPVASGSYRFTHWTINGVRYDDDTCRSQNPASFTLYEPVLAIANYRIASQDDDGDGIPDWYEIEYYAGLVYDAASDTDNDGFDLATELANGFHPRIHDELAAGGLSRTRSAMVSMNLDISPTYRLVSIPPGFIAITNTVTNGTVITTPDLWGQNVSGYRFAYWDLDGNRQQDCHGIALGIFSFKVTNDTVATAHYLSVEQDSDADGLPDWFEYVYYPDLTQDGLSDSDKDGFTLAQEYAQGSVPTLADEIVAGGISRGRSGMVNINLQGFPVYRLLSSPPGFLNTSNIVAPGTVITTPDLWGQIVAGYRFAYWDVDGVRQQDCYGIALGTFSFTVTDDTVATAHYLPALQDSDNDGVTDWFEYVHYGGLEQSGTSDTDGDGFSLAAELAQGTMPTLKDEFVPGGISRVRAPSPTIMDMQPFERLTYVLMDGVLTNFFSSNPSLPGGFPFGTNVAPGLGDWDGDGDLDLFVGSAVGSMRIFENIGSRYTMNLTERTTNFGDLVAAWSGITCPTPALGDWNGDGTADLVVGGNGGTLRIISSTGHFGSPQSPAVNYTITLESALASPALADVTGDGQLDLLVLLDNGTVRVYPNTGNAAMPYQSNLYTENLLGQAVPDAIGLSASDINYDGRTDILVSDTAGRIWEFHEAGGSFVLKSKVWGGSGIGFANRLTLAAGDVDGDGDVDLVGGFAEGGLLSLRNPRFAVPGNLRAFGGVESILLTWDPDRHSRIVGYYVYRSMDTTNDFGRLTNAIVTLPRFEDRQPVSSGTNFYYVTAVCAVNYPGNSVPLYVEGKPSDIVLATAGRVTLWMPDYFGKPGSNTVLQINTPNATGISGTNLEIRVTYDPTILTPLQQVEPLQPTVEKTGLTKDFLITDNGPTANGVLVIDGHGGGMLTGWGNLFDIKFRVAPEAALGAKTTNMFVQVRLQDANGNSLAIDATDIAVMTVANAYFPGDVDGDGILSQSDYDLAMELAVGQRPATPEEIAAGDMNGNGQLDIDDAHLILRMINGKDPNPK